VNMFESINIFIKEFLGQGDDRIILFILIIMITFFFLITVILFIIAVYLRILNRSRKQWENKKHSIWSPIILGVMDGSLNPRDAFSQIKEKHSLSYLLYLEHYIDLLKGKEKDRLIALGRLSIKKLRKLLNCLSREKRIVAMHMISLLHSEEEFIRSKDDKKKPSLIHLREMRFIKDLKGKNRIFNALFSFPFVSPVYISNILADMGTDIIPWLRKVLRNKQYGSYIHLITIETLRRLHDAGSLKVTDDILNTRKDPVILSAWLRFIEVMGDKNFMNAVYPFIGHPSPMVRLAAVQAYIEISDILTPGEVAAFFNDPYVMVAVQASKKIRSNIILPHIPIDDINDYRWQEIFRRMVY